MADKKKKEKKSIKEWFKGLKAEFKRVIWPDKPTIIRQTIVTIVITIIVGILIALIDSLVQLGLGAIQILK